jgi:dihydrofolate reductase
MLDVWCRPRRFETERFYELLGARLLKRYVPTGGDLVMRWLRRRRPGARLVRGSNLESLRGFERWTRVAELVHLVGFMGFAALAGWRFADGSLSRTWLGAALVLDLTFGLWPVALQRYNRLRVTRAIETVTRISAGLATEPAADVLAGRSTGLRGVSVSRPYEPAAEQEEMTKEMTMRKIVAGLFMSLDGVVESPEGWAYQYGTDQMWAEIAAGIGHADSVLLGRRTYQQFAEMWPNQPSDMPMAAFLNNTHKYVVSATLGTLEWGPASLLTGNLATDLADLRQRPGKNIQIPGSPTLVRSLLAAGLLDELSVHICPIVVGPGKRLFEDVTGQVRLKVSESKTFGSGVLAVTYQPDRA